MWVDIVNNETDMVRSIDSPPELKLHPGIILPFVNNEWYWWGLFKRGDQIMIAKGLSGGDIFSVDAEIYNLFMNILEGQRGKIKNTLNLWFALIATSNDQQQSASAWIGIGCELVIDIS